ncbi:MAG: hypothetical protein SFU86_08320 [Pirellulaceae bacterium]|nr:hypothetical protein [Pirellulaceae bacterium]
MKRVQAIIATVSLALLTHLCLAGEDKSPPSSAPGSGSTLPAERLPADDSPASPSDPVIETPAELVIPAGRPEWVAAAPKLDGDVQQFSVSSEPWHSKPEARRKLDEALVAQTSEFIVDTLGSQLATSFPALHYDAKTIRARLVTANYDETIVSPSVGPMHVLHARLEFGPDFRAEIERKWSEIRATSRLVQTGLFAGAGLLILGAVFGFFRFDTATRGYYTGRLQLLTSAAILAVMGAGAVLARYVHWL